MGGAIATDSLVCSPICCGSLRFSSSFNRPIGLLVSAIPAAARATHEVARSSAGPHDSKVDGDDAASVSSNAIRIEFEPVDHASVLLTANSITASPGCIWSATRSVRFLIFLLFPSAHMATRYKVSIAERSTSQISPPEWVLRTAWNQPGDRRRSPRTSRQDQCPARLQF